jgi:hypothetical protein
MKQKFKLITNRRMNRRHLKAVKAELCLVDAGKELIIVQKPTQSKGSFLKRGHVLLGNFLKRIDELATQARETDERIRKNRAEHYAKYGFYFRDRF